MPYKIKKCNTHYYIQADLIQWEAQLTCKLSVIVSNPIKKLYPHCLVLVGSRNEFKRDFLIKIKYVYVK